MLDRDAAAVSARRFFAPRPPLGPRRPDRAAPPDRPPAFFSASPSAEPAAARFSVGPGGVPGGVRPMLSPLLGASAPAAADAREAAQSAPPPAHRRGARAPSRCARSSTACCRASAGGRRSCRASPGSSTRSRAPRAANRPRSKKQTKIAARAANHRRETPSGLTRDPYRRRRHPRRRATTRRLSSSGRRPPARRGAPASRRTPARARRARAAGGARRRAGRSRARSGRSGRAWRARAARLGRRSGSRSACWRSLRPPARRLTPRARASRRRSRVSPLLLAPLGGPMLWHSAGAAWKRADVLTPPCLAGCRGERGQAERHGLLPDALLQALLQVPPPLGALAPFSPPASAIRAPPVFTALRPGGGGGGASEIHNHSAE